MRVTFVKKERHYAVHVSRDRAPDLFIGSAPGYDDWLPHDLLHFVAEAEFGLDGGVFGDLAAGGNAGIFIPVDPALVPKLWRANRKRRLRLPDGRRSEELAARLEQQWRERSGDPALLATLDALAGRWYALPVGGELSLEWPRGERRRRAPRSSRRRRATASRQTRVV